MMIHVRQHYYGHERSPVDATNTIRFRERNTATSTGITTTVNETSGTTTLGDPDFPEATIRRGEDKDEYEMKDFSERSGF